MNMNNLTILFQGDSITDCGRDRETTTPNIGLGAGYVHLSAAKLMARHPAADLSIFNRGVGGHRIVDLYARWKVDCINLRPDVLSVLVGINDTWHAFNNNNGVSPTRYERFYREMLWWTRKELPNIKFILGEPFALPVGAVDESWLPEINERRAIVKKLSEEFDAAFVPFQTIFDDASQKAKAEYWLSDGVHPTLAGHELISEAWLKAFENC
ncbi:MAG: SGNH/GDSL hydrolase family protein [Victivallaceae bacterium]|nr:SGNH/GDSL hydrolase family protein [Victivallaceae bacterium]